MVASRSTAFKLNKVCITGLATLISSADIFNRNRLFPHQCVKCLHCVDGIIKLIYAYGDINVQHVSSCFLRQIQKISDLVAIACRRGTQNHSTISFQLCQPTAILKISHHGLIYEHRLSSVNKGHCVNQMIIPITALYKAYIGTVSQLLNTVTYPFKPLLFHEALYLVLTSEAVIVHGVISCSVTIVQFPCKGKWMRAIYIHYTDLYHSLTLLTLLL